MAYPDTRLVDDLPDEDYGGQPATVFGGPAWAWVNSVLVFLGRAYLEYLRTPYTTVVVVSKEAAAAGQVAVFCPEVSPPVSRGYAVRPIAGASTSQRVAGVYLRPASTGGKARLITHGIVPYQISGFAPRATPANVGLDAATARLRVAQAGDVVVGVVDLAGNVFFTGYGVAP